MKTSTLLRIAAVIAFVHFAGHMSSIPWIPGEGAADLAVIETMKADHFDVIGVSRSYWDFYFGFGLITGLFQVLEAVFLMMLGSLAITEPLRLRPIIALLFVGTVLNGILGFRYFFAIPVGMDVLQAIVLGMAFVAAGRRDRYRSRWRH